jgi:hypothetical protein
MCGSLKEPTETEGASANLCRCDRPEPVTVVGLIRL